VGTPVLPADTTASEDPSGGSGSMDAGGTSAAKDAGTDYAN
jgi:hypothetical protein